MLRSVLYAGPSLRTLHSDYAKQGRIDAAAPIRSRAEIQVRAPVARVWRILADVAGWPAWMPGVTAVRLDSLVAPDATFTWKNGPYTLRSTFAIVEPERELTWTGIAAGAKAIDRHILEASNDGTRVVTEESMSGPFLTLFFSSRRLRATQQAFLAALRRRAEGPS